MSLIDAVLIGAGVFFFVSISFSFAFYVGFQRQMKAFADGRKQSSGELSGLKERTDAIRARADELHERNLRHTARVEALQERAERIQDRWEDVLTRMETLVNGLENRERSRLKE